jgi:hypothetical protein
VAQLFDETDEIFFVFCGVRWIAAVLFPLPEKESGDLVTFRSRVVFFEIGQCLFRVTDIGVPLLAGIPVDQLAILVHPWRGFGLEALGRVHLP